MVQSRTAQNEQREQQAAALWSRFAVGRDVDVRNDLVMLYIPLVKSIVCRMVPTYRKHVEFDDLMSCGLIGLMDAVDKFDVTKDVKFETYATLRIKGEIIDQIRKQDWAPISLRQKIRRIEEGYEKLESTLGRSVSEGEVAQYLSMSADDVKKTLDESHTFNLVWLDDVLTEHARHEEVLVSRETSPSESVEIDEMKELLAKYIDDLPERDKLVISLYYYDEMTLKEIGLTLGVTESRVSQIHSKALLRLRNKMKAAYS